jgi:hypothetical protein
MNLQGLPFLGAANAFLCAFSSLRDLLGARISALRNLE